MVPDPLVILGDHQQIDHGLPIPVRLLQKGDQLRLHGVEQAIHYVIILYHSPGNISILFYKSVDAVRDHADDRRGHFPDGQPLGNGTDVAQGHNFADVGGLGADSLGIGDHFQGRGHGAQVPGHRLLVQQQLQADGFDVPFLLYHLVQKLCHFPSQSGIPGEQGVGGFGNGIFAEHANGGHFRFQRFQLNIKLGSHYPNLPVM